MSSSSSSLLPNRRDRDEQQAIPTPKQQQPTTNPSILNDGDTKLEEIFSSISAALNDWARNEKDKVQSSSSSSSSVSIDQDERKKLLSMINLFLKKAYDSNSNDQNAPQGNQQIDGVNNNNHHQDDSALPVEDFSLSKILSVLDVSIEKTRSFLRTIMMNRWNRKAAAAAAASSTTSEVNNNNNIINKMIFQCDTSSSGTTASSSMTASAETTSLVQTNVAVSNAVQHQQPTFEADAFLFDEEDLDDFEEQGWLSRHYCRNCGRCDMIDKTAFISHSFSKEGLKFLCCVLLEKALSDASVNVNGQVFSVVDVGSRLGIVPVTINKYLSSSSSSSVAGVGTNNNNNNNRNFILHAVEIDKEYCSIQQKLFANPKVVPKSQQQRIQLHNGDITSNEGLELLQNANFIVMNNVFEFFTSECEKEVELWEKTLNGLVRNRNNADESSSSSPPKYLVAIPSLQESLTALEKKVRSVVAVTSSSSQNSSTLSLLQRVQSLIQFASDKNHFQVVAIDPQEMVKFAKFCLGEYDEDDVEGENENDEDEGENNDDENNNNENGEKEQHQHDECCGKDNCSHTHHHGGEDDAEKAQQLEFLLEDFGEMMLYLIS